MIRIECASGMCTNNQPTAVLVGVAGVEYGDFCGMARKIPQRG